LRDRASAGAPTRGEQMAAGLADVRWISASGMSQDLRVQRRGCAVPA
jgi:hypothetical protein